MRKCSFDTTLRPAAKSPTRRSCVNCPRQHLRSTPIRLLPTPLMPCAAHKRRRVGWACAIIGLTSFTANVALVCHFAMCDCSSFIAIPTVRDTRSAQIGHASSRHKRRLIRYPSSRIQGICRYLNRPLTFSSSWRGPRFEIGDESRSNYPLPSSDRNLVGKFRHDILGTRIASQAQQRTANAGSRICDAWNRLRSGGISA